MIECVPPKPTSLTATEFASLYRDHFDRVKAFLARSGCEHHALDDLAQETFLRAWHARSRFSGNARFPTWLMGIAKNVAREAWRKRDAAQTCVAEMVEAAEESVGLHSERSHSLRRAVDQLPPKQRIAITLVYLEGVTQTDAAIKTNCAHDAFRRRLSSGRSRLRRLLGADPIT